MEDENKEVVTAPDSIGVVVEVMRSIKDLLEYKNSKYGNAALKPVHIFYKGNATDSICIRLDDKLNRLYNSTEIRLNDIADVAGYLVLLLISKGAYEDKEEFSDKVSCVLNNTYATIKAMGTPCSSIGVFSKVQVDPWLTEADKYIRGVLNEQSMDNIITLAQRLLSAIILYMAENGMTDLSQFKD